MTVLDSYLRSNGEFTEADLQKIKVAAVSRYLSRNELILVAGEVCRHKTFIANGMLRVFGTGDDGSEHILQFNPELTWTLDAESYDTQKPSRYNISAVERSQIFSWTKTDFDTLVAEIPALKKLSEKLISRAIHNSRQRILTVLSATPEEKYNDFITAHPSLLARLPLKMIASYLGMSIKTLTRIRHAQIHR